MNPISVESLPAVVVTPQAADAVRGIGAVEALAATDRAALVEIGLVGEDGRFTPAGRRLRDDLRDACVVLLFAGEADEPVRRARLYVGHRQMMYVAVPAAEDVRQAHEMLVFPADAVPIVLARWGRLQPSVRAAGTGYGPIAREAIWARCASSAEPPPVGADEAMAGLWSRAWRVWGAQCDVRDFMLTYVDVEGLGTFAIRRAGDESVRLVPRPSSLLWGDLQGVLGPLRSRPSDDW